MCNLILKASALALRSGETLPSCEEQKPKIFRLESTATKVATKIGMSVQGQSPCLRRKRNNTYRSRKQYSPHAKRSEFVNEKSDVKIGGKVARWSDSEARARWDECSDRSEPDGLEELVEVGCAETGNLPPTVSIHT